MTGCKGKTIIVLDADTTRGRKITHNLNVNGFISIFAKDTKIAEEYCSEYSPDLLFIISSLDIYKILKFSKRLKSYKPSCKILLSSSINISNMLEECFYSGIDDYIQIPVNLYELYARIKKMLFMTDFCELIEYHGIQLDITHRYIIINNIRIYLSKKETQIMKQLMTNRENVPIDYLCSITFCNDTACRMSIQRLRKKFKENTGMKIIKSRYGVGYYIAI